MYLPFVSSFKLLIKLIDCFCLDVEILRNSNYSCESIFRTPSTKKVDLLTVWDVVPRFCFATKPRGASNEHFYLSRLLSSAAGFEHPDA